jgi:hypothetical protein
MFRFLLSASILSIICVTSAVADSPSLFGTYGFTREHSCIVSMSGFDPNDFHALGSASGDTASEHGTYTFNGDGTGTVTSINVFTSIPNIPVTASFSEVTTQFFYVIGTRGPNTWHIPGGGSFSGTVTGGPRAGQTFTVSNVTASFGYIPTNAQVLTLSTPRPNIETITYFSGGVQVASFQRICHASTTLVSLN